MTIAFACPACAAEYEVPDEDAGALADCPVCNQQITIPAAPQPAPSCPAASPATPTPAPASTQAAQAPARATRATGPLYSASPSMWRNSPVMFILLCILCLFLIGIPFMAAWWLKCKGTRLVVDPNKTTLRTGIFSRHEVEVRHCDVRKVSVSQGVFQRIFGVGTLRIGSAATGGIEIEVAGIPAPIKARDIINTCRA